MSIAYFEMAKPLKLEKLYVVIVRCAIAISQRTRSNL